IDRGQCCGRVNYCTCRASSAVVTNMAYPHLPREEIIRRVEGYNKYHENKRGQALQLKENEGSLLVEGPLRIFWGLKNPIMLRQNDDIPVNPLPRKRYSVIDNMDQQPATNEIQKSEKSPLSRISGFDDSILTSPGSEVVRRNQIRKSNTVAYRGDRPNKWKRASINGHIYNFDTSVFTPVLGSCTSVTVSSKMTVLEVISTLLDKFKVENEPNEYNLHIITEREGERTLNVKDIPLLERLSLGPSDSAKIFIRDRKDAPPIFLPSAIPDHTTDETPLPEEVEQLVLLPEPVLRGLLEKFANDEVRDTNKIRKKYERIKNKLKHYMMERKKNQSA
ncbi:hypothetical protein ACJMK2_034506, partial [Sinanodonta woodiana]